MRQSISKSSKKYRSNGKRLGQPALAFERLEPKYLLTGLGDPVLNLQVDEGVHLDVSAVAEWHDHHSGNQLFSTGNQRPIFGSVQTPSGFDAIRLDGINDRLMQTLADGFYELPTGNADRTMVVVAQFHGAHWTGGVTYGAGAQNETFGAAVIREGKPGEGQIAVQGWGNANDYVTPAFGFSGGLSTGWMVLTITHDADEAGNSTYLYKSDALLVGQEIGSFDHDYNTNLSNAGLLNGSSISRFVIGEEVAESGNIQMDVAAILVYDEALQEQEREDVEQFLQEKYLVGGIQNQLVVAGLDQPTSLEVLPDGRVLVLQKQGEISIVEPLAAAPVAESYLTINNINSERERGLTDIALDPDFENNNYFYVYYHTDDATPRARISRFTHAGDSASLASEFVLWEDIENSNLSPNHWGGGLDFGPDGKLYLTIGDKWLDASDSQDPLSYGGKILRLNTDGSIPADNPFVGNDAGGFLDEIWAYGLRNPFRANWDLPTGRFFIGDVGGNNQATAREEVNLGVAGANYGWPAVEGFSGNAAYVDPIYDYGHTEATPNGGAIAGGLVYRGGLLPSTFDEAYFFTDYVQGWIRYLKFDGNGDVIDANPETAQLDAFEFSTDPIAPVALEVGSRGELFYIDFYTGELRRFISGNLAPEIIEASADVTEGLAPLQVNFTGLAEDPEGESVTYVWDFGDGNTGNGTSPTHTYTANGYYLATLQVSDGDETTVSDPIIITVGEAPVATIVTPYEGQLFVAGETIQLSGSATDDGFLDDNSYSWTVRFIHNAHTHPVLDDVIGANVDFYIDTTGHDFSDQTGYEIELTVTDSDGIPTTKVVSVFPDKVDVTFDSDFPGDLEFTLDAIPNVGSFVHDTLINFEHTISVPLFVNYQGDEFEFIGWSDGETEASYDFVVPNANTTFTALYQNNGPNGPVLPTDDLVLRLDAQNGVTVDGSGTVTDWTDQSGLGNSLAATGNPKLITGELNGRDVIRFDGTGDSLTRVAGLNGFPAGNDDRSLFVVARFDGVGYGGVSYGDNSTNEVFGAIVDPNGKLTAQGWGAGNDFKTNVVGTGQGWIIQELVLANGVLTHYKDAVLIDTQNHVYATDVANGNGFVIGAEIDSNPFIDMDVAEVLVYDRALSLSERQQAESYLLSKYFNINNTAPEAQDDAVSVDQDSELNVIDVKADNGSGVDSDPEGDPLSIVSVGVPTMGGTVSINNNATPVDTTDDYLEYTPLSNFVGIETFTYTLGDGMLTDEATVTVTVNESNLNSAPINTVPGIVVVEAPNVTSIAGVSIADSDAGNELVTSRLQVNSGVLEVTLSGGTTISSGANQTNDLTLFGTVDDINASLASLQYTPDLDFIGTDQLMLTTDDLGNTGDGGPLQDVDSVSILVVPALPTTDLVIRLDGQTGVTENANGVTGWSDQTAFGNDLSGTGDPQRVVGGLNGLDFIQFDGSGDSLVRATGLTGLPAGNDDRSLFIVARYDGVGYGGVSYGDNSTNEVFGAIVDPNGNLTAQGWGASNDFKTNVPGTGQGWIIQELVLTASQLQHFKDGSLIDTQSHVYNTDVANGNGFVVGAEIDSNPFVTMGVSEVLVYDRALTLAQRQNVEAYLLGKYFGVFNTAPNAQDDTVFVVENSVEVVIDVKVDNGNGADSDPENDPISVVSVSTPDMGGTAVIDNNGTPNDSTDDFIQYTPGTNFTGVETFTYVISDGAFTDSATVTVNVTGSGAFASGYENGDENEGEPAKFATAGWVVSPNEALVPSIVDASESFRREMLVGNVPTEKGGRIDFDNELPNWIYSVTTTESVSNEGFVDFYNNLKAERDSLLDSLFVDLDWIEKLDTKIGLKFGQISIY